MRKDFESFNFKRGQVVWYMPIRFWEEKEPLRAVIKRVTKDGLYVFADEYGHNVYLQRKGVFHSKKRCVRAIELYNELKQLAFDDGFDHAMKSFWRMK